MKLRNSNEAVEKESAAIKQDCDEFNQQQAANNNKHVWLLVLKDKNVRRALIVGTMMWWIHQFSGINTIMYYCATILEVTQTLNVFILTNYMLFSCTKTHSLKQTLFL